MVYRLMYAAYAKPGETYTDLQNPDVSHLSLSRFGDILFLYLEASRPDLAPQQAVGGQTVPFPDGKGWVWVPELYHFSAPRSEEHWKRTVPKRPWVRVNRVRHDKFASYVFYHHQLQEEKPGNGDKYGIIGLFSDYLFLYLELPEQIDATPPQAGLNTHASPSTVGKPSEWDRLMSTHFVPWDDCPDEWRDIPTVLFR